MSGGMIVLIALSPVCILIGVAWYYLITEEWPWQTIKRWCEKEKPNNEPEPEVGTIRIVEKMDKDENFYYIAVRFEMAGSGNNMDNGKDWVKITGGYSTPQMAQEAANAIVDREREAERKKEERQKQRAEEKRRAEYSKVMGEFKP